MFSQSAMLCQMLKAQLQQQKQVSLLCLVVCSAAYSLNASCMIASLVIVVCLALQEAAKKEQEQVGVKVVVVVATRMFDPIHRGHEGI